MSHWANSIDHVRKQLDELKSALNQNDKLVASHREAIIDARKKVEQLTDEAAGSLDALYQLPVVFGALANNKLIGSLILGSDSQVVMHNFTAQRLLPMDPVAGRISMCTFYDSANGKQFQEQDLPWNVCLQGRNVEPCIRLKMRHPNVEGEVHFEVGVVPLRKGSGTSGVVVLFIDATEPVKVDQYIKTLCSSLDQQVNSIEAAHRELQQLADKMGVESFTAEMQKPTKLPPPPEASSSPITRVLLVDDIPVNQKLLVMQLRSLGVQIDQATNGAEAVQLCKKQRYSLVFMDCDMPILNGFEATGQIRKHEKTTGDHVPIVAMTSYDRAGDREKCLSSGMDDYLFKGGNRARLQEIIEHHVFGRKSEGKADPAPLQKAESELSAAKLDLENLEGKFGEDAEKIVAMFFGSNATLLNCLEFAIQDKDSDGVRHFAHALKGPCSTLGLSFMVRISNSLIENAESGHWVEAADQYRSLRAIFQQLKTQVGNLADPAGAIQIMDRT